MCICIQVRDDLNCEEEPYACGELVTGTLLVLSVLVCTYIILVLIVGRIYEVRLLHYVGVSSPVEYEDFLNFVAREEKRMRQQLQLGVETDKFTADSLREMVDTFVDAKENNEENRLYRRISHYWSRAWVNIMDIGTILYIQYTYTYMQLITNVYWMFFYNFVFYTRRV